MVSSENELSPLSIPPFAFASRTAANTAMPPVESVTQSERRADARRTQPPPPRQVILDKRGGMRIVCLRVDESSNQDREIYNLSHRPRLHPLDGLSLLLSPFPPGTVAAMMTTRSWSPGHVIE